MASLSSKSKIGYFLAGAAVGALVEAGSISLWLQNKNFGTTSAIGKDTTTVENKTEYWHRLSQPQQAAGYYGDAN